MPKKKRSQAPFWMRVGSAFENGYGDEGRLATWTARFIVGFAVTFLTVVAICMLPYIGFEKLLKKLSRKTNNDQTPRD
jgi:hypothetical protein